MYVNFTILPLQKKDYALLISIWERSVRSTHDFLTEEDLLYYKSRLPIYFDNVSLYGVLEDAIIKGFLGISDDNIEMLFVDSLYFNSGIGSQLIKYAVDELNIRKVDVNEQNKQALNFYKKHGFLEYNRSESDSEGKTYPIIHLQLN